MINIGGGERGTNDYGGRGGGGRAATLRDKEPPCRG